MMSLGDTIATTVATNQLTAKATPVALYALVSIM